jgi:hypothetical protein
LLVGIETGDIVIITNKQYAQFISKKHAMLHSTDWIITRNATSVI